MILDGHIHIFEKTDNHEACMQRLELAGVDGGIILSLPPDSFQKLAPTGTASERLEDLFSWCEAGNNLFPFFWIDPVEANAVAQVNMAVERGVVGFKVICDRYYPGDRRALPVFRKIAEHQRPILFHSGILWDGKPSSIYNRPAGFEALLEIKGLRFALAHIGWPWCDELIAVYGKFLSAARLEPDSAVEMFIDLTPGTPPLYRRDALTKLLTVGYDITRNMIFGTDCSTNDYNVEKAGEWIARDTAIYQDLAITDDVVTQIFSGNLKRFLGLQHA